MKDQIVESNAEIHLNDMVADAKLYRAIYEPVVYWPRNERKVVGRELQKPTRNTCPYSYPQGRLDRQQGMG